MARAARRLGTAAFAAVSLVAWARDARAGNLQVAVGVDANAAVVSSREVSLSTPFVAAWARGMDAHLGLLVNASWLHLQPEVGYGYLEPSPGSVYDWKMHRAYGGARIGFGEVLVPTLYGHAGWGWRSSGAPMFVADGASWEIAANPTPPAWADVGLDAQVAFF